MRMATIGMALATLLVRVSAAHADSCDDWRPRSRLLAGREIVTLSESATPQFLTAGLTVVSPLTYRADVRLGRSDMAIEMEDEARRPVPPPPRGRWTDSMTTHEATKALSLEPGGTANVAFSLEAVTFPRAGVYWLRVSFAFPDLRRSPGAPAPGPKCVVWSDWTRVDYRPVVRIGGLRFMTALGRAIREPSAGVLVVDRLTSEVLWIYRDGAGDLKKLPLGRTDESPVKLDPTLPGGKAYRWDDLDARLDADGVTHVVYSVAGGKTAYVKLRERGVEVERRELPGKKILTGPTTRIEPVDKPATAGSSVR